MNLTGSVYFLSLFIQTIPFSLKSHDIMLNIYLDSSSVSLTKYSKCLQYWTDCWRCIITVPGSWGNYIGMLANFSLLSTNPCVVIFNIFVWIKFVTTQPPLVLLTILVISTVINNNLSPVDPVLRPA